MCCVFFCYVQKLTVLLTLQHSRLTQQLYRALYLPSWDHPVCIHSLGLVYVVIVLKYWQRFIWNKPLSVFQDNHYINYAKTAFNHYQALTCEINYFTCECLIMVKSRDKIARKNYMKSLASTTPHKLLLLVVIYEESSTPSSIDNFVNSQRIFNVFLHRQTLGKMCDKTVVKIPPHAKRVATLPCKI